MSSAIAVIGAGAFGTALSFVLAKAGRDVALWGRDASKMMQMQERRQSPLAVMAFPLNLRIMGPILYVPCDVVLLCVPTQNLRDVLESHHAALADKTLVICCKGIEHATGALPSAVVSEICPNARIAVLTGPSFAVDLIAGKPTALTLAADPAFGVKLQQLLSTPLLRLYLTDDILGAQWGGALKNVVAIGAGVAMGAELGESACAAIMTRGFAEMQRLATDQGALRQTLAGLSGFGDLVLTCTSAQSRNFAYGLAIGAGRQPLQNQTVEGVKTAQAVAARYGDMMPVVDMVAKLVNQEVDIKAAIKTMLDRPLKDEIEP
ncbi:MAG: NAD(P)H-dependent glycerol-3-phosphate dehydrogenase [Paracoccaceae bacterium]|jgi:glycerol-3-phosphate dehydrogenase (NAD(P)+)